VAGGLWLFQRLSVGQEWHPPTPHKCVRVSDWNLEIMTMPPIEETTDETLIFEAVKPNSTSHAGEQNEKLTQS
jgi:hypothetical protein